MSTISEIVDALKPLRGTSPRAVVEADVQQAISNLKAVNQLISREASHKAADDARDLMKRAGKLRSGFAALRCRRICVSSSNARSSSASSSGSSPSADG